MNRYYRTGILTLLGLGGFYLWRNRYEVQRFLESKGIRTPLDTAGGLGDTIRSGVAKLTGRAQRDASDISEGIDNAGREAV